ncbi:MAG: hypothetical protein HY651_00605 [Acidobacteria bacterium]|nr:hypothetical protein [Acidobacteriota bacterium]
MPECDSLVAGGGAVALGILLLYKSVQGRYKARLAANSPSIPCGSVAEGLVQVTGRAVSAANIASPVLGLPCLVSQVKVESYEKSGGKETWEPVYRETVSVPFHVEDSSGRVWVDPSNAEFSLLADVEYSTDGKWKPKPSQLVKFGDRELTAELLEERLRHFYEQRTAAWAPKQKLRFTENNLMAGDPVTVLGPAYATLPGQVGAGEIKIHRVHPDDPFVIGDGTPGEVAARLRKEARWMKLAGLGFAGVGLLMILDCYW